MQSTLRLPRVFGYGCVGALLSLGGCATVTQEEPPSLGAGNSVTTSNVPAGSGGGAGGGTAPTSNLPAPVGPAPAPTGNGGSSGVTAPPTASGGAGGAGGSGAPAQDAGPRFPTGMSLLQENFENFQAANWASSAGSTWQVQADPQVASNVYTQTETNASSPHLAAAGNTTWGDVVVEADVKILAFNGSSSSYMAGLCVRVSDAENFYLIGVRSNDGKVGLRRYTDGGTNLIQSDFEQGTTGVWYHLRVEAIGDTITAYLDDELMFSESDDAHANGGIALCTVRATASFDNVSVTAP